MNREATNGSHIYPAESRAIGVAVALRAIVGFALLQQSPVGTRCQEIGEPRVSIFSRVLPSPSLIAFNFEETTVERLSNGPSVDRRHAPEKCAWNPDSHVLT